MVFLLKNDTIFFFRNIGVEKFQIGNCEVTAVDLGGHEGVRALWSKYAYGINAVVYIVDCADQDRFPESKKELDVCIR